MTKQKRSSVWFHEVSAPDLVEYATKVCDLAILGLKRGLDLVFQNREIRCPAVHLFQAVFPLNTKTVQQLKEGRRVLHNKSQEIPLGHRYFGNFIIVIDDKPGQGQPLQYLIGEIGTSRMGAHRILVFM